MTNNTIVALNHPDIGCVEESILNYNAGYLLSHGRYCLRSTAPAVVTVQPKTDNSFKLRYVYRNDGTLDNNIRGNFHPHPLFPGFYLIENDDVYNHIEYTDIKKEYKIFYYIEYENYTGEIEHRFYQVKLKDPGVYIGQWDTILVITEYYYSRYVVCTNPPSKFPIYKYTDYWKPPNNDSHTCHRDDDVDANNWIFFLIKKFQDFIQQDNGVVMFGFIINSME